MSTATPHTTLNQRKAAPLAAGGKSTATTSTVAGKTDKRQAKKYDSSELHQFKIPDLTIKDLLSAIPAHCFERSTYRSSTYVVRDFILVAAIAYAGSFIDPSLAKVNFSNAFVASAARWSLWALYSFAQGLIFVGIWIIAHECGHQSYSPSKQINNTVGWFLHSALLVPYHSWRISHARHHAATGHLTRDEVFVPRTRAQCGKLPLTPASDDAEDEATVDAQLALAKMDKAAKAEEGWTKWLAELLEDAPLFTFLHIIIHQLFGWPLYLFNNASGQLHYPKGTNHYNPSSTIFDARHRSQIIMSDVGLGLMLSALGAWGYTRGFGEVVRYYVIPYLWCNHWIVMLTYLQHTDPLVPHYAADAWTFPRGALCTVDRQWLGPIGAYLFHGITETHVLHHVSSKVPHYHAWEATEALKARLGQHYQYSDENAFVSLWKNMRQCRFVEENDSVAFYRDNNGVPRATVAKESAYDSGLAMSE